MSLGTVGKMLLPGSLEQSLAPNTSANIRKTQLVFTAWQIQIIFTEESKKK